MLRSPFVWLGAVWIGILIHLDWHGGRPGHDHFSLGLSYHWLLAILTFAPVPWFLARRFSNSVYRASALVIALGVLIGQGLEPLGEVLLFSAGLQPFTNPARWRVFAEFMAAGLVTFIASAAIRRKLCGLSGPMIGLLAALLAGCGTEPSPELLGAWNVTATYTGGDLTCTVLATLTVDVTQPSLSGSFAERQAGCTENGTPLTLALDTTNVIGTADGRRLSFTPQPQEGVSSCALFNFEGEVAGDRMSGTVRTTPVFCQGTYVQMNGTWEAQRS